MSHEHSEIVMPKTGDVQGAVTAILARWDQNSEESCRSAWWDCWKIGGRFSGSKLTARFSQERLEAFRAALVEAKVTVSGLVCGKETISPSTQIPLVDSLWHQHFPEAPEGPCPLFEHSGDAMWGDVLPLCEVPERLTCYRVIFATTYHDGRIKPSHVATRSLWNGVSWEDTRWDGTFASAVCMAREHFDPERWNPAYAEACTPQDDWLVVTIDIHS